MTRSSGPKTAEIWQKMRVSFGYHNFSRFGQEYVWYVVRSIFKLYIVVKYHIKLSRAIISYLVISRLKNTPRKKILLKKILKNFGSIYMENCAQRFILILMLFWCIYIIFTCCICVMKLVSDIAHISLDKYSDLYHLLTYFVKIISRIFIYSICF